MFYWLFKILVVPFFYLVSLIPFFLLYPLSNLFSFLLYYIIGYRKEVVIHNLKKSFPEKSQKEIKKITKQFYIHFVDVIFETIKLISISEKRFKSHCRFNAEALQTFESFFAKNQSVVGIMGHCGNWEWAAIAHQFYFKQRITGVYQPLSNKSFDEFMFRLRSRKGGHIIPMNQVYKQLLVLKEKNISTTLGLIADQASPPESAYWCKFMNQDSAFFYGPEKIAKKFNFPVLYLGVKKIKRGYYEMRIKVLCENPNLLKEGEITQRYVNELESDLREQPFNWLWSHRRWKHKKPVQNT
ncbi:MAG: lysophospholipid acyltransferase family protein [Bacteroidia bacterium]|nr:lysophospholipid acyltransferase family protein [Bacteroidia bacterium]